MAVSPISRSLFLAAVPALGAAAALPAWAQAPTLKIGATANDTFAQAYYAQDMGFFTKAGLNVEILTFTNGASVSTAVASGAADIGVSNPVGLANAVSHGIPFVLIAGGGLYNTAAPTTVLCVGKDSAIKTPKDFVGQTIAVSALKDLTDLARSEYLAKNGVDPASVKAIELPFSEMGAACERGTVAGAIISEPSLSASLGKGQTRVFAKVFDDLAPHFLISTWFSTRDWYTKNPSLAKRYATVMADTATWANANHDQSAAILARYSKITLATMHAMTRATYATSLNPQYIDPLLQLSAKAKLTDKLVTLSSMMM